MMSMSLLGQSMGRPREVGGYEVTRPQFRLI